MKTSKRKIKIGDTVKFKSYDGTILEGTVKWICFGTDYEVWVGEAVYNINDRDIVTE